MGEKIFGLSPFPSPPDLNSSTPPTAMILQEFLTPAAARTDPPISGEPGSSFLSALSDPFFKERYSNESSGGGDRRYKRMMKNRESATRSRNRRRVYTIELEKKIDLLTQENKRLRRIIEAQELFSGAAAATMEAEAPIRSNLCRSLSALF